MLTIRFIILCVYLITNCKMDQDCYHENPRHVQEGNMGDVSLFPFLGVLRVEFYHNSELKMAVTGVVLIKSRLAIANARDVTKFTVPVIKDKGQVMFILANGTQTFYGVKGYTLHPEYEQFTYNTIALIDLTRIEATHDYMGSMTPVCWPKPTDLFTTSSNLYVLGYTDENRLLEKVIYKMHFVAKPVCEEFYSQIKFDDFAEVTPTSYLCASSEDNDDNCKWDSGMALASNDTGYWIIVGLGISGPGCKMPTRFLDMNQFIPWIVSTTVPRKIRSGKLSQHSFNK